MLSSQYNINIHSATNLLINIITHPIQRRNAQKQLMVVKREINLHVETYGDVRTSEYFSLLQKIVPSSELNRIITLPASMQTKIFSDLFVNLIRTHTKNENDIKKLFLYLLHHQYSMPHYSRNSMEIWCISTAPQPPCRAASQPVNTFNSYYPDANILLTSNISLYFNGRTLTSARGINQSTRDDYNALLIDGFNHTQSATPTIGTNWLRIIASVPLTLGADPCLGALVFFLALGLALRTLVSQRNMHDFTHQTLQQIAHHTANLNTPSNLRTAPAA